MHCNRLWRPITRYSALLMWLLFFGLTTVSYFQHEIRLFVLNYTPYHLVGYSYPEDELPNSPPSKPAPIVLLHTYMRGGSSFLGSIFDRNPNVLYYFEPIYSLYQAAMNIEHYRLQPLHIYAYPNGTLRETTEFEDKIVFDRLFDLMDCKMDKLQMEQITTTFISRSQALRLYEKCMGTFTIAQRSYCTILTSKQCGGFIADAMNNKCHVFMADVLQDGEALRTMSAVELYSFEDFKHKFITPNEYRSCLKDVNYYHEMCKNVYKDRCEFSHLKVAKLIRNNVKFLRRTLKERKDVFVIYQPRDPRGTLLSRKSLNFLTFDFETEAKLECELLYKEYKDILQLKQYYPKQVLVLRYEDMAEYPLLWTKTIYNFIGAEPPQMVFDSIKSSMSTFQTFDAIQFSTSRSDGKKAAWNWKEKISKSDRDIVDRACKDFFHFSDYDY